MTSQYEQAAFMWCQLRREFLYAAEMVEARPPWLSTPPLRLRGHTALCLPPRFAEDVHA